MAPIVQLAQPISSERQKLLRGRVEKNPKAQKFELPRIEVPVASGKDLQPLSQAQPRRSIHPETQQRRPLPPQEKPEADQTEKLRALTHSLKERLREKDKRIEELSEEKTSIAAEKEAQEQRFRKTQAELETAHLNEEELQTQLNQKSKRLERLKNSLRDSRGLVENLEGQLAEKEAQLSTILQENEKLKQQIENLRSEKKAAEALAQNLRQSVKNLEEQQEVSAQEITKLQARISEKEAQSTRLEEKIAQLEEQLRGEERLQQKIQHLRGQVNQLNQERDKLVIETEEEEAKIVELQKRLAQMGQEQLQQEARKAKEQKAIKEAQRQEIEELLKKSQQEKPLPEDKVRRVSRDELKKQEPPAEQPTLTKLPNTINGFVRSAAEEPIEGAIVMIKDLANNNLRALRTQEVGQFMASTPLPNGTYRIVTEKEGLDFDILEVELNGEILPLLVIEANN